MPTTLHTPYDNTTPIYRELLINREYSPEGPACRNVISDFACINKVELLPWDSWGMMTDPHRPPPRKHMAVLDGVAALATSDDLDRIRSRFSDDDRLNVPPSIVSFIDGVAVRVRLDD